MTTSKRGYQYSNPVLIAGDSDQTLAQALVRLKTSQDSQGSGVKYDEFWLQKLIYKHPASLPIAELEPGIGQLIPVGMELPTSSGFIDNLFATPEGNLIVVECKLYRNPEARRKVLAQIIDYAQSMSKWSCEELDHAIQRSVGIDKKPINRTLIDIVRAAIDDADAFNEAAFSDAVCRNLRLGRMLLLVVGDGIREDAESLSEYLQQHAGFHFTLGLVEAAIYKLPNNDLLFQPRVLARTLNIVRGVVTTEGGAIAAQASATRVQNNARALTLTEETFLESLKQSSPATADALTRFLALDRMKDLQLFPEVATKSMSVKWVSAAGRAYNLSGVDLQGLLKTYSVTWRPNSIGRVDLGHNYLENLSRLVEGEVRKTKDPTQWYVVKSGTALPQATEVLSKPDLWFDIIAEYQKQINLAELG